MDTQQSFVLTDVGSTEQIAAFTTSLGPPDCLMEDVLDREEVPTGGHLEEGAVEANRHSLTITLTHLPDRRNQPLDTYFEFFFFLFLLLLQASRSDVFMQL